LIFLSVLILGGAAFTVFHLSRDRSSESDLALDPENRAMVSLGERIYQAECAVCHGAELEGQENWQERRSDGRMPAPPHDATGHTWHHPDQQLFALTKYGPAALVGGDYESDMPGFDGALSDAEIIAVLSFIKSRWPPEIQRRHDQINAQATP
jgi:mono/diheme cytochrome c family protein